MGQASTFRPNKNLMARKLDGEWVFLNLESGVYYGLNETGSLIWDQLASQKDYKEILQCLEAEFSIDRPILEKDFNHFLKEIQKEGLARVGSLLP